MLVDRIAQDEDANGDYEDRRGAGHCDDLAAAEYRARIGGEKFMGTDVGVGEYTGRPQAHGTCRL